MMWSRRYDDIFIVSCVFWINFCLFGLIRSGALLYVALVDTFNCSHELASWPLSLAGASICMIGPIAGSLEKVMSIRAIVTVGVFVASLSCVLCYWAYDVTVFVLLVGGLYGIGTGLTCTLTPVLLNERFPPQQRTLACGIAYSGSTVGSFFWPYLLEWLIYEVNLRGSMLIYGGLLLHALVGSIFLRRPAIPVGMTDIGASPVANGHSSAVSKANGSGNCDVGVTGGKNKASSDYSRALGPESEANDVATTETNNIPEATRIANGDTKEQVLAVIIASTPPLPAPPPAAPPACAIAECQSGSYTMSDPHPVGKGQPKRATSETRSLARRLLITIRRDLSVMLDPYFQLVTVSAVCFFFVYVTVFIVIPDYAMDNGIPKSEAMFLITIFGISDLISKPLPGMLTYKNFLSTKALLIAGSVSMGAICFILPHTTSYMSFAIITFLYGLLTGGLVFLSPILITENIAMERAPVAFGLSNFFVGVTGFLRPPFIGYFKDAFDNYHGLFYAMGVLCMVAAGLWVFEPLIQRRRESQKPELTAERTVSDKHLPEVDPLVSPGANA